MTKRVVEALNAGEIQLEKGKEIRAGFFIASPDFIKGFSNDWHHLREEGILFIAVESAGIPAQGDPIGVTMMEHERVRTFNRQIDTPALKLESGDASAQTDLVANPPGYVALLQQHNSKGTRVHFPMAEKVIPAGKKAQVLEDFNHVEHEETGERFHEKFLATAEKLEEEIYPGLFMLTAGDHEPADIPWCAGQC